MKRLLSLVAVIAYFALPHVAHAQTAYQTCAFSDPTHCYGIGPGNVGQAYMSNGPSAYPAFSSLLPGVTSVNGTTIAASAGTAPGSTGAFTIGHCLEVGSTSPLEIEDNGSACGSGGGGGSFSSLTGGTNTSAAMVVGTGASLAASGSGSITATSSPLAGLTGLGTSVAGALATNTGSAGAFVVQNGALGTPASGVATNLTGTASGLSIGGNAATATALSTTGGNGTFWGVSGGVQGYYTPAGGGNVSNTGTPTAGQFAEWTSATVIGGQTLGGDCTLSTATITCTKTSGTAFSALATLTPGTGIATFLGTPTSANLAAALTDETGTGSAVFATSPTLVTPAVKGSSTGVTTVGSANASATNYTATLPANTGTLGELNLAQTWSATQTFGTNISIGNINLGTPTAITLTNGTGLPPAGLTNDVTTINSTSCTLGGSCTITASAGSITPGTTTISGATAPCLIDNSTGTTMDCAAIGSGLALSSGTLGTTAPNRTVTTSPTVASTDMGGAIFMNVSGGGTLTIPAISSTVFANGMTAVVVNYSASTAAVSTTPMVNSGGGCVSGTGIPAGDAWQLVSNGTTLDCIQSTPTASGSMVYPGAGIPNSTGSAWGSSYTTSGSGTVVPLATSAVLTTPAISGSSTGTTTIASANVSATNYTATLPANTGTVAELNVGQTFTSTQVFPYAQLNGTAVASSSFLSFQTAPFTGGTGSTTRPELYFNTGATAPTTFSTAGTFLAGNTPSAFTGNLEAWYVNGGAAVYTVNYQGNVTGGTYNGSTIPTSAGTLPGSSGAFTLNDCLEVGSTSPLEIVDTGATCGSGGGGSAFNAITTGTNTTATMTVGTGGTLTFSGSGTVNASTLGGATFAAPGAIGSGTASTGAFTTLSASSTVSGTGFSTYLASPPAIGGTAAAAGSFTTLSSTGTLTNSKAGAASTSAVSITGAPFTGGSGTTTFPLVYLNDGTAPTTFSTSGTEIGVNTPSAFAGNLMDFHVNGGASVWALNASGNVTGGTYNGTTIPTSATLVTTSTTSLPSLTSANGTTIPASATLTQTIASGTATLGTSAIASGACATVVTVSATGVATTDVVKAGFNSDPTGVTGYGVSATGAVLTIYPYPTANNINLKVCNSSSASITPGSMTLNWSVTR